MILKKKSLFNMKKKRFIIPGIFHPLVLNSVDISEEESVMSDGEIANYYQLQGVVNIKEDLTYFVKRHALYHEISHHIMDTLAEIKDDEVKSDLLATYLIKLVDQKDRTEAFLK